MAEPLASPAQPLPLPLSDYDYPLAAESIAQTPREPRDAARLLVVARHGGIVSEERFAALADYLAPGDLLVINETLVSASRLHGRIAAGAGGGGQEGGRAELLLTHRVEEGLWHALVKPGKRLRVGARVATESGGLGAEIAGIIDERGGRVVRLTGPDGSPEGTDALVAEAGLTPLPPYIHADDPNAYKERYQAVYGREPGSAAAPTAGLHFTPALFERLGERGVDVARVTLHVGIGTFRPIESDDIRAHVMHEERGEIPAATAEKIAAARGRIVAVGTTSVRALESASTGPRAVRPGAFRTSLYVTPGYAFQTVDAMVTNFHMPRSTLLVLVSAFAGRDTILRAYAHAAHSGYQFLSFGDAMLILGDPPARPAGAGQRAQEHSCGT